MDLDIKRELINVLVSLEIFYFASFLYDFIEPRKHFFKDINECTEGIDICDRRTQLCLNTPGGYSCQDKVTENCLTGLRFNPSTRLCEGAFYHYFALIASFS